jgi:bifunctional non-homologous end joining protein LigD
LTEYRSKRRPGLTPEPVPARDPGGGRAGALTFVIQEHHASTLHWDFRLERDGVLASWALPKGLPVTPEQNRLAVQVEDHPLEYGTFAGSIPDGQYGAGEVVVWDHGYYECQKWRDKEIMVVLHGERVQGRYVLFPTRGKNWMIHRMDPPADGFEQLPKNMQPMLAVAGPLPGDDAGWAYEFKWDGMRVLVWVDGGRVRLVTRNGNDVTKSFPELRGLGETLGSRQVLLDGELIALGADGVPSFSKLQHRMHASDTKARVAIDSVPVSLVIFDLLHVDGDSLLDSAYDDWRAALEALGLGAPGWGVTPSFTDESGSDVFRSALTMGMEGVMAKRRSSHYLPGKRSTDWIKVKNQHLQEAVIGGFTPGNGERRSEFGSLLLGIPSPDGRSLDFVGKVGSGFSDAERRALWLQLKRLVRATSPFGDGPIDAVRETPNWVTPKLVCEVRFTEWTAANRLRHPVWRGLRPDKSAREVRHE